LAGGITHMLPTEDSLWLGEELSRRFRLKYWSFALTATDTNRFARRFAREITGRPKILVFDGCYHGTLSETSVNLKGNRVVRRSGSVGITGDPQITTRIVEFNDLDQLDRELSHGNVACVLAEPALTNCSMVLPIPGFHDGLRKLTRRHNSLLIIDETHTFSSGPAGYTGAFDLDPDMLTLGKPIGTRNHSLLAIARLFHCARVTSCHVVNARPRKTRSFTARSAPLSETLRIIKAEPCA
jgi:glutamate-1-semialdehyde 2,1-aminomutase